MRFHELILRGRWALAGLLFMVACNHASDRRPTNTPPPDLDPALRAKAHAEFRALATQYQRAANGRLGPRECTDYAQRFTEVYDRYGAEMIVAWFNAGAVWQLCGDTDKAEEIYASIVSAEPGFAPAHINLGVIFAGRRDETAAIRHFQRAIEIDPLASEPRNNLATTLRNKYAESPSSQTFEAAEDHLQNVLAVDSTNRIAFENLARLYYDRGRLQNPSYLLLAELVITQAHRVLETIGEKSADLHNLHGLISYIREDYVEALRSFKRAVEIEPQRADAHMNIAMIALSFRDYATAQRSLAVALEDERRRTDVEAWLALGVAQRGLRKYDAARDAFARLAKLDPDDPRALYNLGILHQEHVAPAAIEKDNGKKGNEIAREHFTDFVNRAGSRQDLKAVTADARARIRAIDDYLVALRDAEELEKRAAQAERLRTREVERERERLLELERRALKRKAEDS
jgi:tetratricopeptide (TPR) repeat protein